MKAPPGAKKISSNACSLGKKPQSIAPQKDQRAQLCRDLPVRMLPSNKVARARAKVKRDNAVWRQEYFKRRFGNTSSTKASSRTVLQDPRT